MRKPLYLLMLFVIGMMTWGYAQESRISFTSENGEEIYYDAHTLAQIVSTSDTSLGDDEYLLMEYESVFHSRGPYEPAVLVLIPDYYDFYIIIIQENKRGKLLSLRILTRNGWIAADKNALRTFEKIIN